MPSRKKLKKANDVTTKSGRVVKKPDRGSTENCIYFLFNTVRYLSSLGLCPQECYRLDIIYNKVSSPS